MVTDQLSLVSPTAVLESAFWPMIAEFDATGEGYWKSEHRALAERDFAAYIALLDANAQGRQIPGGYVAASTYWLVREGAEIVGKEHPPPHALARARRHRRAHRLRDPPKRPPARLRHAHPGADAGSCARAGYGARAADLRHRERRLGAHHREERRRPRQPGYFAVLRRRGLALLDHALMPTYRIKGRAKCVSAGSLHKPNDNHTVRGQSPTCS